MVFEKLKSGRKRAAFTLPEVIVSMSVIVIVVMAATNMLTSIIRSNTENQNTLIAYGLAQEGLEAMRNIRDSNWLLGADFGGTISNDATLWGGFLPKTIGVVPTYYAVFPNNINVVAGQEVTKIEALKDYAPWSLIPIPVGDSPEKSSVTEVYKLIDNDLDFAGYGRFEQGAKLTQFHRYVGVSANSIAVGEIQPGDVAQGVDAYRVTSYVTWVEAGRNKMVQLDTELTDWKR